MATVEAPRRGRPRWLAGLVPLLVLAAALVAFIALDAPGLERRGVPVEELVVDRTTLRPGEIELHVRNDGPDAVEIEQAIVNDAFVPFEADNKKVGRLAATTVTAEYPWIEGQAYEVALLTATGGTVAHSIDVATESPDADAGFFGLMGLIGLYVGIIPVAIGMLWLPWLRRLDERWVRFAMALTVGLLVFLGLDALDEGGEIGGQGSQALGGASLVFLGGLTSYLVLSGVEAWLQGRREKSSSGTSGAHVAMLVAIAIGLHNLGEGLAIGSAYAVGALALGAFLVIGFALHNTTEGLAIVAPVAKSPPAVSRLVLLGLVAGAPAILGAWIGASAFNSSVAAFLLGAGAGAIVQVVQQLVPSIRDRSGLALQPLSVAGILLGFAILYATSLLVSV